LLLLGRNFPGFGDDFFEVNFQDRRDAEQYELQIPFIKFPTPVSSASAMA
jgi:hypothetical protein